MINREEKIISMRAMGGTGATQEQTGLPPHNPEPSTPRGKRRHEKRNESEKARAKSAWAKPRATKPSRYQKALYGQY